MAETIDPGAHAQPDQNYVMPEDGSYNDENCIHDAPESLQAPVLESQKRWGMSHQDFVYFMSLVCRGLERADNRQRYLFKKVLRPILKQLRVQWPFGRPLEDIQQEIQDQQIASKIIIPKGINPKSLEGKE